MFTRTASTNERKSNVKVKVKILVSIAGRQDFANGFESDYSFSPGDEVELSPALAEKWIRNKTAEAIVEAPTAAPVPKKK